jgi:YesN/AraC family two-component response regulator
VGFNDIYYFSKCVKKLEGINPSEYKELYYVQSIDC